MPAVKRKNPHREAQVRKALMVALMILIFAAFALAEYLFPFRTLLPATKLPARAAGSARLHFLDVGQADCTIVEFPDGDVLVIDAGDGSWESRNKIIRYLKGLAPTAVSLLVTHADADHYGGMTELLQCFGADALYLPVLGEDAAEYRAILRAAEEIGCPTQTVTRYDVIARPSGAYLNCISPYSAGETDHNESSATLFFSYEGVNAVFCGDVSAEREGKLAREYALDETLFDRGEYVVRLDETDILKTAHHGSGGSSSEEWLGLLGAETAIVSCGRGNFYGHPAGSALKRLSESGCEIYRTDELGDVVIVVADGKYTVYTDYTE